MYHQHLALPLGTGYHDKMRERDQMRRDIHIFFEAVHKYTDS